jgi:hypothetical protein
MLEPSATMMTIFSLLSEPVNKACCTMIAMKDTKAAAHTAIANSETYSDG